MDGDPGGDGMATVCWVLGVLVVVVEVVVVFWVRLGKSGLSVCLYVCFCLCFFVGVSFSRSLCLC